MVATQDALSLDFGSGLTAGAVQAVSPAVRLLDQIQTAAIAAKCSDIHIEPYGGGGRVRFRRDGLLHQAHSMPAELFAQVASRVKILAGMDIAERRAPQDGRYGITCGARTVEARASAIPTIEGEKIVVRLLDYDRHVPKLADLGMPVQILEAFSVAVAAPHGFIVVTGPTGSGKTTTLYAAVTARNLQTDNVCSVEDPVEVRIAGLSQVQVNARAGVTFASALRAFLRQDPNVVMVGELRDAETAGVAAAASLSGTLILATLHANDAVSAVERLCQLGIDRQTLSAGLTAIVSQRLVRRFCVKCARAGCDVCLGTGFAGRSAIFEAVFVDSNLRTIIGRGAPTAAFARNAARSGYQPMFEHGLTRVEAGETSEEELRRAACEPV